MSSSSSSARLLQAAAAFSAVLHTHHIGHAFHGGLLTLLLGSPRPSEVRSPPCPAPLLTVPRSSSASSRAAAPPTPSAACARPSLGTRPSPQPSSGGATGEHPVPRTDPPADPLRRLYVTYHEPIPAIQLEVLPAGEEGPRRLDASRVMLVRAVPFLNVTEFLRAKMKAWIRWLYACPPPRSVLTPPPRMQSRRSQDDAEHVVFVLTRFWAQVDINRIQEDDMDRFVAHLPAAAPAWKAIKRRYGQ